MDLRRLLGRGQTHIFAGSTGAVLLILGIVVLGMSFVEATKAAKLDELRELTPEAAADAPPGQIAVRGTPEVESPLKPTEVQQRPLLYVQQTRRSSERDSSFQVGFSNRSRSSRRRRTTTRVIREDWVPQFALGAVQVVCERAEAEDPVELRHSGGDTWVGVPADAPVTVVGRLVAGRIAEGDPFIISPRTLQELRDGAASSLAWMRLGGLLALLAGGGISAYGFLRWRTDAR